MTDSVAVPHAGHFALSTALNLYRYLLKGIWLSSACVTRLADLREMLALLMVRMNDEDGALCPNLASLWPLDDFFHFLAQRCLISVFLC